MRVYLYTWGVYTIFFTIIYSKFVQFRSPFLVVSSPFLIKKLPFAQ